MDTWHVFESAELRLAPLPAPRSPCTSPSHCSLVAAAVQSSDNREIDYIQKSNIISH